MPNKSMGQFIAALRKANGLTQKDLAEKLNVSDKSVSRWERDKSAPDISLIPVIAEIFSVTCDELLCGERKSADSVKSDDDSLSPRAEKQQQRILKSTLSELKNRSFIVLALSFVGIIAAAICNLGFNRAYIGFFTALIFFAVSVICQIIFTNKAFFAVSDVNTGIEEIGGFKLSAVKISGSVISFIAALAVFCLPLIILPDDSYFGVTANTWLAYGALWLIPVLILCLLLCNFAVLNTAKKCELFALYKKIKRKFRLKITVLAVLAVVIFITFGVYAVITNGGDPASLVDGKIYDKDGFVALMETEVSQYDNSNSDYIMAETENFEEDESEAYEYITDDKNNIVCKFVHRNESVVGYEYEFDSNGELIVSVTTSEDMQEGINKLNVIKAVFAVVYAAELVCAAVFYFKKRKNIV